MPLADADVQKIAGLARLSIEARDIPAYRAELSGILGLVEQMNAIDTRGVLPLAHPLEPPARRLDWLKFAAQLPLAHPLAPPARLRADEVTESCPREQFQQQAPLTEDGYYLTPKVIE